MMSSLYIGATGVKTHGEGMGVITQNLSNVNTVAYKQMSMQYSDLMSQYMTSSSANLTNCSQKGMGVMPGSVRVLHTQGGYETGSAATDLAIEGKGFFGVTKNGQTHYTRAGNFRFTKDGELVDPSGWNVMGKPIVNGQLGGTQPIKLDLSENGLGYMAPQASTRISTASRLGGLENKKQDETNPFFGLAAGWNGTNTKPLGTNEYSYAEPLQYYDDKGVLRSATIYYDKAASNNGMTVVEYVVGMPPGEDASGRAGTESAGLLMAGTITFASNGEMANMTAFTPPASGSPADLGAWTPASLVDGKPQLVIQATGAASQNVTLDMGFTFAEGSSASGGFASAADAAANSDFFYTPNAGRTLSQHASIMQGDAFGGLHADRDGFAAGSLYNLHVDRQGLVQGMYSNGQTQELAQLVLYRFVSEDGLRHEGNNHYSATPDSGLGEEGMPGDENFGNIAEYSLEQSNVDYAREFSHLIITQRGFQMNSKVVTTSDQMLQKALELKR